MILISACLAGVNCKYNGRSNENKKILEWIKEKKAILVCPEQLGGLSTPRIPCEILGGDGEDVLSKKAKVINKDGEDRTNEFLKGAEETLKIAKLYGIKEAILKQRSPSCGCGMIYDGTFSGTKKTGDGVTAALLKKQGMVIWNEENYPWK
ncbi:DUF523 domain-containing protein [Inediibacterium massiliense]|uniref:DUF523 domain-containing protein n=1 Tax=Inediibacterium massiliense TaxID=1658111 RepID=UPI0006B420BF|nr:DUF523 domain-containing protein [Inediibacterium massiliense]